MLRFLLSPFKKAPSKSIDILSSPAFANRSSNPYNSQIYDNIVNENVIVHDYSDVRLLTKSSEIVHIHWPEYFYFFTEPSAVKMFWKASVRMSVLYLSKLWGTKVFWTIHNLEPHECRRPAVEKFFMNLLAFRVDSLILLNHNSHQQIQKRYPVLKNKQANFIPHCHLREIYKTDLDKKQAKNIYGFEAEDIVLGHFGRIRRYKNIHSLIRSFRGLKNPRLRLMISGECADPELRDELSNEAKGEPRIRLHLEDLSNQQLANVVTACDLAVLPYHSVLNSGTAFLALSLNRPILLPSTPAIQELIDEVGPEWVQIYEDDMDSHTLQEATHWGLNTHRRHEVEMEQFTPETIGMATLQAYKTALNR
jgi:glycosyltransferase involved in cell wall biosynthesis